jgi:hypothetical protein
VPVAGYELLTVQFSGGLSLTVYGDAGKSCTIALAGPFVLRTSDGNEHHLDAEHDWAQANSTSCPRPAQATPASASSRGGPGAARKLTDPDPIRKRARAAWFPRWR